MQKALLAILPVLALFAQSSLYAQKMSDEEILSAIKEHPYRAAGGQSPYYFTPCKYTAAPKGYKIFYVSHFGRHGSRHQDKASDIYNDVLAKMDSLHNAGLLTPQGDSIRLEIQSLNDDHYKMEGMLSSKGAAEHTGIAKRLVQRCPGLFQQQDRRQVFCTATTVPRTVQSMAGFIAGLSAAKENLDFHIATGFNIKEFENTDKKASSSGYTSKVQKALSPKAEELAGLQSRLFKGYEASVDFLYDMFGACTTAGCLDLEVDPLRFFTPEELFAFYKRKDVKYNIRYGTFAPTRDEYAKSGKKWLRYIIADADAAIKGNGHCADFRFGHDTGVGPMLNLIRLGGYAFSSQEDAPYRDFQSFRQICMGSNVQLEFYKNAKGTVLVKALVNEREETFPGLESVNGIFYKWNALREYLVKTL